MTGVTWRDYAACTGIDPEAFFPSSRGKAVMDPIRKVCNACPVQAECLKYAIDEMIPFGVWGGLDPFERGIDSRHPARRTGGERTNLAPHGSTAAVRRHQRHKEPLCAACKVRASIDSKARNANRKQRPSRAKVKTCSEQSVSC